MEHHRHPDLRSMCARFTGLHRNITVNNLLERTGEELSFD